MGVIKSIFNVLRFNSRNWRAVMLCVFAATIFWLFNSLNKDYTTNVTFPVRFEYDEENYIPVKPLPAGVRINVTGMGWDLFRRSLGFNIPPLVIPLERPSDIKKIVAIPALFAYQVERLDINFVVSDTFRIAIEPKSNRWISLQLDPSSIHLEKDYIRISEPRLRPDSIYIEGPLPLVNSFAEPVILKLDERKVDSDYSEDVEVELLNNELIKRDPPTVRVSFDVDKLVRVSDSVKLEIRNYPTEANPQLGINALLCRFAIPERYLEKYDPDSLSAVVDLKDFEGGVQRLLPVVEGLPPHSQVLKIDSIFVKF